MPTTITKNRYQEIERKIEEAARKRSLQMSQEIAELARQECPVSDNNEPGHVHTRDTIEVVEVDNGYSVEVGGAAVWIEFGTHLWEGHPFLMPAADLVHKKYRNKPLQIDL